MTKGIRNISVTQIDPQNYKIPRRNKEQWQITDNIELCIINGDSITFFIAEVKCIVLIVS